MERASGKSYLLWMLAIVGVFVFLNLDSVWARSVDLAHHYALAFRISEQWVLTSSTDPTLGVMNHYPRGSHVIAAVVGNFLNSTFLGIQVTTLVSVALLWMCATLVINSLPGKMARISLVTFVGLTVLNALTTKFDVHGGEVIGNFFYAQLVGHAVLFGGIVLAIKLEKNFGVIGSASALAVLMLINATIHLLAAIEMLGLIAGLLVVYALFEHRSRKAILQRTALAAPIALFSSAALFLHPSFAAMRAISENNGSLSLHNLPYPGALLGLCLAVILTSLVLLLQWMKSVERSDVLALKYASIYGGVTAALCLLQFALSFLGHGSEYAVKKYAFGLTSMLLLQLSVILGAYVSRKAVIPGHGIGLSFLHPLVPIAAFAAVLFINFPEQKKASDASDIVVLERELINLADTLLPAPEDGKNNVIIGLGNFPPTINYQFSIAVARTPVELAVTDVLRGNYLTDPSKYSYVISSRDNKTFGSAGCESISQTALSIVPSRCIEGRNLTASYCRQTFDFSTSGAIPPVMLKGFSYPERHGRWSDGDHASFECITGSAPVRALKLQVTPFRHGSLKSQRLEVYLNGRVMYEEGLSASRGTKNPIIIEIPDSMAASRYLLEFKFPDAESPKEVGYGDDARKLGFSFQRIEFE